MSSLAKKRITAYNHYLVITKNMLFFDKNTNLDRLKIFSNKKYNYF